MKQPKPAKAQTSEPTIPITKEEIKAIRDIARGLNILETVAEESCDIQIQTFWWLISKVSEPAWMLGFETLSDRWEAAYPKDKILILD
jgi:hypothetical protein